MAEQSVGQISLDLILNSKDFKKQLTASVNDAVKSATSSCANTISSTFSKLGKVAVAAFSVKAIYDFGKAAVELGSDLAEVQNVVDVSFGNMSEAADAWAKNALVNFGLSETTAKRYLGTFGAMASSFGYTNKQALGMAETLTGLSGDVASFYNISSSEAYTKLKSVFTGETESLKELGVVMTQTALDNFALANGFGKTTKQMTEQEKVALRLAFVTKNLDKATGDFKRTGDGFANSMRVLVESWRAFQAQVGQALIQVITPVIRMLNILMQKLIQLATVFNKVTAYLFGKQDLGGISSAADTMSQLEDNTAGVGEAAKKTAKEIKKSLAGFDEINVLQNNKDTSSSADVGASGAGMDFSYLDAADEKVKKVDDDIKNIPKTLQSLRSWIDSIKKAWQEAWNIKGEEYIASVKKMFASIDNMIASISEAFRRMWDAGHGEKIFEKAIEIATIFNNKIAEIADSFTKAWNSGSGVFKEVNGQIRELTWGEFIADLIFSIIEKFEDLTKVIVEKLGTAFANVNWEFVFNTWTAALEVFNVTLQLLIDLINALPTGVVSTLLTLFLSFKGCELIFKPLLGTFGLLSKGFNLLFGEGTLLGGLYKMTLGPIFDSFALKVSEDFALIKGGAGTLKEVIQMHFAEMKLSIEAVKTSFKALPTTIGTAFKTLASTVSEDFAIIKGGAGSLHDVLVMHFGAIATTIAGITAVIGGVVLSVKEFLSMWSEGFSWIKETLMVLGVALAAVGAVILGAPALVAGVIAGIVAAVATLVVVIKEHWEEIKAFFAPFADWFSSNILEPVKNFISAACDYVYAVVANLWNIIKAIFIVVGDWVNEKIIEPVKKHIDAFVEAVKSILTALFTFIIGKATEYIEKIKKHIEEIKKIIQPIIDWVKKYIAEPLAKIFSGIWDGIVSGIKNALNFAISIVEGFLNGIISAINWFMKGINKASEWASTVTGGYVPSIPELSKVSLPKLAQGGYVAANTPQLAVVGDNKREGEIITPESKIAEAVAAGMRTVLNTLNIGQMQAAGAGDITIPIYLDGAMLENVVVKSDKINDLRTGAYR
jgi:phage-related protein